METEHRPKIRKQKYGTLRQALEPRILFDASFAAPPHDTGVTADQPAQENAQQDAAKPVQDVQSPQDIPQTANAQNEAQPVPTPEASKSVQDASKSATDIRSGNTEGVAPTQKLAEPVKLVFIDSRVQDPQTLLQGIAEKAEVHFLDPSKDGVQQMDAIIKGEQAPISSIHILSHGESGSLTLGNSVLNEKSLNDQYADEIASWKTHLTDNASVLLYGCDVAKGDLGQQFVTELSVDLSVHIAASVDYTGAAIHGGNWNLEFQTGTIGAAITDVFSHEGLSNYQYLMAQPSLDLNGPTVLSVTDNFALGTYTGGSSNLPTSWSGGWTEFDASTVRAFTAGGSATGGNIVIPSVASGGSVPGLGTGQEIAFLGHTSQYGDSIERAINLDAYTSATLTFSYRTAGLTSTDAIEVDISHDGGKTFATLGTLANVTTNTTVSYDISNHISDNTVIKFAVNSGFTSSSNQQFFFDNVAIAADGGNFVATFSEQTGAPIAIVDPTMTITEPSGQLLSSANVTLTNMKAGDQFAIGSIPATIIANVNNVNGTVSLLSVSPLGATTADFTTALKAITFKNTSVTADETERVINVTVTNASSVVSTPAISYIDIAAFDNPAVVVSHSINASALGTTTGNLFDNSSVAAERTTSATNDYDPDTANLSAAILAQGTKGTAVVNADGSFTYKANAGATGTDSFTYVLTSQKQLTGANYQMWNTASTSLLSNFPGGAATATGFITDYNVDKVAINSGSSTLDNFVVRFTNSITVSSAGSYTFYSGSDSGSVVYVDGQLVVNNDGIHTFQEKSGAVTLAAGTHTIQVDFMENTGQETLAVSYLGPDTSGVKTDLSTVGTALVTASTTTGTVNVNIQSTSPLLALGGNVFASDTFSTAAYTNNNGTINWAGAWTELNDGGGATGGVILVTGGKLQVADTGGGSTTSISRQIDLLSLSSGSPTRVGWQLSFNYDTPAATIGVFVQISADGGANWTTLDTISSSGVTSGSKTYDISNYASANVQVRFLPTAPTGVNIVNFDNVRVDASQVNYTPTNFIENGAPVPIASADALVKDSLTSNITSATITISNFQTGDTLSYDNFVPGITATLNGNTLTLSGTSSGANYATALQHVFYSNSSDNPATLTRTINVTIKDALNNFSNTAVSSISVVAANDAPTGVPSSISLSLNTNYVLQTTDFALTDIEGNTLQAVKIASVPASVGVLQFDTTGAGTWSTVTANQTITAANIAAGRLRFVPTAGSSGLVSFTFQVQDTGGTANSGIDLDPTARSFSVNVLPGPNTAPTLTRDLILNSSLEDNLTPTSRSISQLMTDNGADAFSDPDPNAVLKGLLIVGNSADANTQGSWQYSTDGTTWFSIGTVGDTANTMGLALSAATQVRFVPVTDFTGAPANLTVRAVDDTYTGSFTSGATRVTVNASTHGGSTAISNTTRDLTTSVNPVNDAPNLVPVKPILNTVNVGSSGQLISDFVKSTAGGNWSVVTDPDTGAAMGIAVVDASGTNGTWSYSIDNGLNWQAIGTVTNNSALLLRSTDLIRFNPNGVSAGNGALTYRAWDQSTGITGNHVDTTQNGGTTPYSVLTDSAVINSLSPTGPALANISSPLNYIENASAGAIDTALTITDTGASTLSSAKVSLTNFVSGQDVLSFTNDGLTMGNITASFDTTSGVLSLSSAGSTATLAQWQAALRAVKYANSSDAPNITTRSVNFQVNDSTGVPSNVLTTTVTLTAVSDAPSGANKTFTVTQSSNYVFSTADFGFTDTLDNSANALAAVQITVLPTTGTLKLNGVNVTVNSFISVADIDAGALAYTAPAANATRTIQFKVQDTGTTANGGVNLSAAANTLTFTISGTNRAPLLTVLTPSLTTITENDVNNAGQTVSSFLGTVTDADAGSLKGIAVTTLGVATNGSWQYSLDNGANWINFPTISTTSSLLLRSTDMVRFVPNGVGGGGGTFIYRAWDRTSGIAGTTVNTTVTGNPTAFSTNTATATIVSSAVNDAPTVAMTASSYSATEQVNLTLSGTGISIADIDVGVGVVNATLSVGEGTLTAAAGTTGVVVTGSGTNSVLLSGTLTQINNLLAGLNSSSLIYNNNRDAPAAATNLTVTVSDLGGSGSGGTLTGTLERAINITSVNDAPTFSTSGTVGGAYTENAAGISIVTGTISIGDVDTTNFNGGSLTVSFSSYVTGDLFAINNQGVGAGQIGISGSNITYGGNIIGTFAGGSASDLVITLNNNATPTALQALVTQLRYQSTSDDPTVGGSAPSRALTIRLNDGSNTGTGGALTASLGGTINITAFDDAPSLTAAPVGGVFLEGAGASTGTPVLLFNGTNVSAIESGQTIKSVTLTVGNLSDGAAEQMTLDGLVVSLTNGATGTTTTNGMTYNVSLSGNTATVVLSKAAGVNLTNFSNLINSLSYQNSSQDPTSGSRTITLTQLVDSGSSTLPNVNTTTLSIASTVTVIPLNDAPTISATPVGGTFTEDGSAVSLFNSAAVSTIEAGQTIKSLTFTVGNILDTTEQITVDGTVITLANGASGTTSTNGMTYNVSMSGGTATVVLTKAAGVSTANISSLINGLSYQNTSQDPTSGARTISLTQIIDTGGVANGGVDTTGTAIASIVNVTPVNDAPTLVATATGGTFTEDGSAVSLFNGAAVSTIEAGQTIKSLTFTVGNILDTTEQISVDGTVITLANGASGTTSTNGMTYNISMSGGTATVVLTKAAGVSTANISSLINGLSYQNTSQDPTSGARTISLTQIIDTGGVANGGVDTTGTAIASIVNVTPVNDAPTLVATATGGTFTEDGSAVSLFNSAAVSTIEAGQTIKSLTFTVGNILDTTEQITVDGTVITLANGASGTTSTNGMTYNISMSGGTATVVLTKAAGVSTANISSLINGLSYQNTSQDPTSGARTISLTQIIDTGGVANGGVDTTGTAISSIVNVTPVNDAPTLVATAAGGTFTEDGSAVSLFNGAAVSTIEAGQTIKSLTFTVGNILDTTEQITVDGTVITLANGASGTTSTNGMTYNISMSGGTATVVLTKAAGVSTANISSLINGLSYQNTSQDPTSGARTISLTQIIDTGGVANGGVDTTGTAIASIVNVTPVNDAPTLVATAAGGTFTEDGSAVSLFNGAAVSTIEAGQTIKSLTFTVGNILDTTEQITVDGTVITLANGASGTTSTNGMTYNISMSGGTATVVLTKAAGVSTANISSLINGLSYQNTSQDPTSGARTISLTQIIDTGGVANGGVDTTGTAIASIVNVTPVNDAPTLVATAAGGTFTEDGSAVSLFNGAAVSTIEAGQTIKSLTFTVGNILDTTEQITVDGTVITLANGANGTTSTNGMTYNISMSGGTATVVLTKAAGVSTANISSLINGLSYQNTSQDPTSGARTISLTQIIDTGGVANGGVDTTGTAIASIVNVTPVNDAPTLVATATGGTFTEDGSAVSLFNSAAVSTIEAGQTIKSLTFTVGNILDTTEQITVDGTVITLANGASGTTSTNGMTYNISMSGGTATVVLTKAAGVSTANISSLINGLSYQNISQDPTSGARTISLTQIIDTGGVANGGVDTTGTAIASIVNVTPVNDAPTLVATATGGTFTEDGSAVSLFNSAAVSTIEAGQTIKSLTFTVGNVLDTTEQITVDGTVITLANGANGTTSTNGMTYNVSMSGGTATVVLTKAAGVSTANISSLINGLSYQNTSQDPTSGARTISLTQIIDTGGVANGGVDTTGTAIASIVNVTPVNDAPTLVATATGGTFTEDGSAVSLFNGAAVSTIEAGQTIKSLTFTVGNILDTTEQITVDGTVITLANGANGTTSTNGMTYNISMSGGTATVVLTKAAGVSTANISSLINGLSYQNTSQDPTSGARTISLTQIIDTGGVANGGVDTTGTAIASIVNVTPVNDAPTLVATATGGTFTEDGSAVSLFNSAAVSTIEAGQTIKSLTFTVGNILDTTEQITVDGTVITLANGANGTTSTNGMTYNVSMSGGTATVVLTKAAGVSTANISSLINGLSYQNTSQDPTSGARTISLTQIIDTGGVANGGVDTTGTAIASIVNVTPVNDAPTLVATATGGTFTEDGSAVSLFNGAAVSTIEAGQTIKSLTFTVGNILDTTEQITVDGTVITLANGANGTTSTNGMTYNISMSGGTATVVLTKAAGVSTANISSLINGLSYQNTSQDPTSGARTISLTQIIDTGGVANGGVDTTGTAIASIVNVTPVNDAPTLVATAAGGTFTEDGSAVSLFNSAAVSTIEAGQTIKSLTFTVGNVLDTTEQITVDGTVITLANGANGTTSTNGMTYNVSMSGGTATVVLTKAAGVSTANISSLINGLSYQNISQDPTSGARTISLTQIIDTGGVANGGVDTTGTAIASIVNVTPVNDAPTLVATAAGGTFTEDGSAVSLFNSAAVSTIEAGQTIKSLTFTVGNILDTTEQITVDGTVITLANGANGTTSTNGMTYNVSMSGGTATVVLTKAAGVSTANISSLINGLSYQNTSQDPTSGARTISLTQIIDTGGVANGGVDTTGTAIASIVNVTPVNDAPTLVATAAGGTFTEDGSAVSLFNSAAVSTIEAGQTIKSLTFTVGNILDTTEQITVDGTVITLANGANGTTSTNGMTYNVSMSGGTATVVLTKAAGVSTANISSLINGLSYQNTSQDPTSGARTISLTQIIDTGGVANGGVDTTGTAISSIVNVTPVNDAPTLVATAAGGTFTEDGSAVSLFNSAAVSTIEAGQTIKSLTFTVGNILDTTEQITVDGTVITLANGASGTTSTNGMTYNISMSGGTATVVLTKAAGVSTANISSLINGLSYQNTSQDPTSGARTISLTQIIDTGGVANGGVDTTGTAIASIVNVTPVNDAPTLVAATAGGTFTEGASPIALFNNAAVSTIEAGQTIKSLTFTVGNILDTTEQMNIDGSIITLANGASGTTSTNGMTYNISMSGGTATVVLSKVAGVSTANMNSLINGLTYQNTSLDPTAGTRTISLTQIIDSGGVANGGVDSSGINITAIVNVTGVNNNPVLAGGTTQTYIENSVPIIINPSITLSDIDTQTFLNAKINITNYMAGEDVLSFTANANTGNITSSFNATTGVLTLSSPNNTGTLAQFQAALRAVVYANTSDNPNTMARDITFTIDDGSSANNISNALHSTINVLSVNDAPFLTVTPLNGTFDQSVSVPTHLFTNTNIKVVEYGQGIKSITLTLNNLMDGAAEQLQIDGSSISLDNVTGITQTHGIYYTVQKTGLSATVTLTKGAGMTTADANQLINNMMYQNISTQATAGPRSVMLTKIVDTGGTLNGGVDTGLSTVSSTVNVLPPVTQPIIPPDATIPPPSTTPPVALPTVPQGLPTAMAIQSSQLVTNGTHSDHGLFEENSYHQSFGLTETNPITTLLAKMTNSASWGANTLEAIPTNQMTTIINGLSDVLTNLKTNLLNSDVNLDVKFLNTLTSNTELATESLNVEKEKITAQDETTKAEKTAIREAVIAKFVTNLQPNRSSSDTQQASMDHVNIVQAKNSTFKDKIEKLLKDFGFSDEA